MTTEDVVEPKPQKQSKRLQLQSAFEVNDKSVAENGEPEDDDKDGAEGCDRSKAKRFKKLLEAGSLPEQVLDAWARCTTRTEQTSMINTLFRMEGNRLTLTEDYTLPKTYQNRQTYQASEGAYSTKNGFGKTIFMKRNNLTEEELATCLLDGSVVKWKSGDLELYAARNIQITKSAEKKITDEM